MERNTITEDMISEFIRCLREEERSNATVEKYVRDVRAFSRFAGTQEISKELLVRYKQFLVEKYMPASVNSMLAAVNRFLKIMGYFACSVRALRIQGQTFRSQDRELSKAEYLRLLEAAKRRKNNCLLMLMQTICATGIRVSELRFITVEAVRNRSATVSLKGKTRQVLLPATLCKELKRYAREKGITKGMIFITKNGKPLDRSNILHAMKSLCKESHVERSKVFPHNLRHLFACLYYQTSKDISRLADILGHSSINTTRIYTSVSGSEQRKMIEKLGLIIKNTA